MTFKYVDRGIPFEGDRGILGERDLPPEIDRPRPVDPSLLTFHERTSPMSKKSKLRLKLNIGTIDNEKLGLEKTKEGDVVDVDEQVAEILLKNGWADPVSGTSVHGASAVAAAAESRQEAEDESPVSTTNVTEAVAAIGNMRSK